jgi:hypothetical protein
MLIPGSLIPGSQPGQMVKPQTRLVGQVYQGFELQQNEVRPIRIPASFAGTGDRSVRLGVAASTGSSVFRNSTASRSPSSEELFANGSSDRVAAVNSLTLLAVIGCGGAVVASLMWMVACGMFAHEFTILQRLVVVRH